MTEGVRPERVSEEFREILAEEIPKLKDPRVGFVTVTGVEMTPDLRLATVRYTVMGEESERKATRAGLRSARSHLRSVIGRQVRMKFLPDLRFLEDEGIARADRVDELLKEINRGPPNHEEEDRGAAG
jgi:ribosome-binding factor A